MKKMVFGGLFLLLACGSGEAPPEIKEVNDPAPVNSNAPPAKEITQRKVCSVVRIDHASTCDIYTLDCDGETEYAVICHVKPVGTITNPPRPIR